MFPSRQKKSRRCRQWTEKQKNHKKNIAVRTSDNFGTDLDRSDLYIGRNSIETQKDFMSGLSLFQLPAEIAWDNFTNAITKEIFLLI